MNGDITTATTTTQRSQQFQLLVNTIETTFKGNTQVNNILSSLQSLFAIFDDITSTNKTVDSGGGGGGKGAVLDGGTQKQLNGSTTTNHFEREMMLGVITMLLNHLIKGLHFFYLKYFICKKNWDFFEKI